MAFNPFHHFRRYSKVVFAGLAILCMVTFVLSSGMGRGDMLSQISDWASGRSGGGVLTLYGKKYDLRQVYATQMGRRLASEYMLYATSSAQNNLFQRAMNGTEKLDGVYKSMAQDIMRSRLMAQLGPQYGDDYRRRLQNASMTVPFLQSYINEAEQQKKKDDVDTLSAIRNMIVLDANTMDRDQNDGFFGGRVNQDTGYEETADFLIWLHQADKLGIHLSNTDINFAVRRETMDELTAENAKRIDETLRQKYGRDGFYSADTLLSVLGDEFRARLARAALLGEAQRTRSAILGGALTPEESWALFKDARTNIQVSMIDVPVKSFLDQVKATPTDSELRQLYDKYRNDESAPYKDTPGFKEPRRIQVEWILGDASLSYYQKAAAKVAPLSAAIAQLGCAFGGLPTGSGTGIPEAVHAAAPFAFVDAPLEAQLEDYRRRELPWTDVLTPRLHDTSLVRPETITILVGAAGGAMGTGAPAVLSAPLAFEARAIRREAIDRGKFGMALIGMGTAEPVPFGLAGIPAEFIPKPLSMNVLRPILAEKSQVQLAKLLVRADLDAFRVELTKLSQDKDKTKAPKYVADFLKERGLPGGKTAQARDVWSLGDDPGLANLKDVYRRGHAAQDILLRGFPFEFFNEQSTLGEAGGVFVPRTYFAAFGSGDDKSYMYWLTEDQPARTQSFDKARPLVEAAWKNLEARKLAQKEADRLADQAKKKGGDRMQLRDLATADGNREYFELGPMARFMLQPSVVAGQPRQYTNFRLPEDRIPFPSDDLLAQLLGLRDKRLGDTIVVSDRPKDNYFVASLLQRDEPSQEEFRYSYVHSMAGQRGMEYDPLLAGLATDSRLRYRADAIKQLRAEANLVINKEVKNTRKSAPRDDETTVD